MHDQSEQEGQLETARGCAKHFLQPYVIDGWTLKALKAKPLRINRPEYSARTGPGEVEDHHQGEPRKIARGEIAITRIGERPECAVYSIEKIKAEIHDEARGYRQQTLADLFTEMEERPAPAPQERKGRPAVFRSYNAGYCQNPACGEYLGFIETDGGRDRLYCDEKCRVAAHRVRKRQKEREAILKSNVELRQLWQRYNIHGDVLYKLQAMVLKHGKPAALDATHAAIAALDAQRQGEADERTRLIDEIMSWGAEQDWPELKTEEFRILPGLEEWSRFVGNNPLNYLRMARAVIQMRQDAPARRKRLAELSKPYETTQEEQQP